MPDREKVIEILNNAKTIIETWVPMFEQYNTPAGIDYAISLLKEQETTFEKDGHHIICKSCGAYFCDRDREGDQYPQNFCPNCGKAVKWDDY